jgi:N-methylhydantoinase A/oxoprolinase/acetone carboxylase beta subunit
MAKASSASLSYESLAIGIDIGGTGTKYGIVDRNGNLLFSGEMTTRGFAIRWKGLSTSCIRTCWC